MYHLLKDKDEMSHPYYRQFMGTPGEAYQFPHMFRISEFGIIVFYDIAPQVKEDNRSHRYFPEQCRSY